MSRILLDTHIILFALGEPERLGDDARELIANPENVIFYSPLSIWEIAIKHDKHPEDMPVSALEIAAYCKEAGYREAPLTADQACVLERLDGLASGPLHKDPFDRMLLCQALAGDMLLLTNDRQLANCGIENVLRASAD